MKRRRTAPAARLLAAAAASAMLAATRAAAAEAAEAAEAAATTTTTTTTTTTRGLFDLRTCYAYNGTSWHGNTRCPGSDACCGADSTCYSNRLCKKAGDNFFVRGPCAVRPWGRGECAQICRENETRTFPHVVVCLDGSYCCDSDGPQCCVQKRGVFLDGTGNVARTPASTILSWGPERTLPGYQTVGTAAAAAATATATATSTEQDAAP
ncbi:hypothetical protein E4U41_004393, partial [Claviceps citrina]